MIYDVPCAEWSGVGYVPIQILTCSHKLPVYIKRGVQAEKLGWVKVKVRDD